MNNILSSGLRVEPKDTRDIPLGALITLPKLSELPEEFELTPLEVKDQGGSDKCSAYATCTISELQEGVALDPHYSFAVSKYLSGDVESWGQKLSYALKGHVKIGAIQKDIAPVLDETASRDLKNYPDLSLKALEHAKKSYVEITGQYDPYDNVRATLFKYRNENRGAVMGLDWHWSLNDYVLEGVSDDGFGHLISIIGWNKQGIVLLNSAGISTGKFGRHVIPRKEFNYYVKKYNGAFMFIDLSPDELRAMIEKGVKLDTDTKSLLKAIINFLKNYVSYLSNTKLGSAIVEFTQDIYKRPY